MKNPDPTDFNELLLRLYRLSHELPIDAFQDAALALIKPVLPFDTSMWGTATATPVGIDIHTIHLHRQPQEMLIGYDALKHQDRAAAVMTGQRRATQGFNAETLFADRGGREFRAFLARFELENCFISAETDPKTNFVHWITLFRADRDAHGTEDERRLLARLAPHVMQALTLNRVMHLGQLEPARAASPRGMAIADLRGVLYHADPHFEAMLRAEWGGWDGRVLPQALLQQFLLGEERYAGRTLIVQRHVEQRLLFLKARARCRADTLTARESTIARLMAKGDTHKEIAQTLNRSPATVRNHIQAIYAKLEVGNVAGLIETLRLAD